MPEPERPEDFAERTHERLRGELARPGELELWIDGLVDQVLEHAEELGGELRHAFSDELIPGSAGAQAQDARHATQVQMISAWWEERMGFAAFDGVIAAILLLLQGAELRVADPKDAATRKTLRAGIAFVIRSAVARYRAEPTLRSMPRSVRRLVDRTPPGH